MGVLFNEAGHEYKSIKDDGIDWISVTSFIGKFKRKFDPRATAKKVVQNKKSKWYGMKESDVIAIWDNETERAITLGNWYHRQRESDFFEFETISKDGVELPIVKPIIENGVKISSDQRLCEGIYPEHLVYLKSAGICGQADLIEVIGNTFNITDYKTNKEIKEKSFTNWEGVSEKMEAPLSHLDDCNLNHYNLQLSIYAYIIKKHNPRLSVGKLTLQHVKFSQIGNDKNGYPIIEYSNGEPVIEDIVFYELPYLKDEVSSLMHWLKDRK